MFVNRTRPPAGAACRDAFFQFTRFDGIPVRIYDGVVEPLPAS